MSVLGDQPLAIASAVVDGVGHLYLSGEFDVAGAAAFDARVEAMGRPSSLLVEASKVDFVDSMAVRTLVRWQRHCAERGGALVLVNPSEIVVRLLALLGLTTVFSVPE